MSGPKSKPPKMGRNPNIFIFAIYQFIGSTKKYYISNRQRVCNIFDGALSILNSVAVKNNNIRLSNNQLQLPVANHIFQALSKLPVTFNFLIAKTKLNLFLN